MIGIQFFLYKSKNLIMIYRLDNIKNFPKSKGVYKIYLDECKSKKIYVGSASGKNGFYGRWKSHISQLKNNKSGCNVLQKAFNKYFNGNNLIFEILEICDAENCLIREQYYIDILKSYNKGYNARPHASNNGGIKMKKTTKELIYNKWRIKRDKLSDDVGKLYESGKTTREICKVLKISRTFLKRIFDENNIITRKDRGNKKKMVYQYSLDGNFIKEFESLNMCSRELNLNMRGISLVLNEKCSKYKNYYFSFKIMSKEEILEKQLFFKKKLENKNRKYINIKQYNFNNELLNEFDSIDKVILFLGIKNKTTLYKSINTNNLYKGFLWKSDIIK